MTNKILFVSLGCDKNLVDTEMMMGMLADRGYSFTDDEDLADVAIVNTCCFIGDAKEESIGTILELAERKKSGDLKAILVCGCLGQRYRDEVQTEIPEVDAIVGTTAIDQIADTLDHVLEGKASNSFADLNAKPVCNVPRILTTTGNHYSYLKIAEGCGKRCSYCIIPKVRGDYRSVPMEMLIKDAKKLVSQGVRELILVAQETTLYGIDLYGEKSLPKLLRELCKIEDLRWIRVQYCYPEEITQELIDVIREEPKVCHYLDLPIQHASDKILKKMGRKTSSQAIRDLVDTLRDQIPDICLRTTLISGFPGETQEDFEQLYRFVNEIEFDRLGVFPYSREEDTVAASMPDQVPEEVARSRADEIMELQQAIVLDNAEKKIGKVLDCIIEGYVPEDRVYVGRTYMDSPGVDGFVFVPSDRSLMTGDFVTVRITEATDYDLIGEICDEPAQ